MISSAFKGAYSNQVGQQSQTMEHVWGGVKTAGLTAVGIAGYAGGLGSGVKGAMKNLGGRIFGLGGNLMSATLYEKKDTMVNNQVANAIANKENTKLSMEDVQAHLSGNPINNPALKTLSTVFEKLTEMKNEGIINKKGNIESSLGEIDPNSELGKKILREDDK